MKILIATNSYPTEKNPVHQTFIKNIYSGLKQNCTTVDLLYNRYFRFFKSDPETGNFFTSVVKTIFLFISCLPYMLFKAKRYDIIYSHAVIWPGFLMLLPQYLFGVKHVCYAHGTVNFYPHERKFLFKLARFTLKKCDFIVTNSAYMQGRLKSEYDCSSEIITPGFSDSVFMYKETNRDTDLFFAGSAVKRKGVDIILETISQHKKFYTSNQLKIKLNLSGGDRMKIIEQAESNDIDRLISFGDKLSENQLAQAYQNSKVFLFPSSKEPLGLVGIEAIACGAIVVGSDCGGIREFIKHGENGFLFEENNIDEFQYYIEKALKEFPDFQNRQPGISKSVTHYSLKDAMDQTIKLFSDILESSKNNLRY